MSEKVYVGNGKEITGTYGNFLNVGLKMSELQKYTNEKGYCNVTISKMKNPDKNGNTHSVAINDYKPVPKKQEEDMF